METVLTSASPPIQKDAEQITAEALKAALTGNVRRPSIPFFYQVGLLLVALVMVLLPIVYVAFAVFCGYGVYWYAVHGVAVFSGPTGGIPGLILRLIIYFGPLVGGAIAVFFMFKPILARRPTEAKPIELNPAQHPRLYQFIAHISDLLNVAMPSRVYLGCGLNAGAGFRRGWMSFFGNDLVLDLGLSLVAGVNTRQWP